MITDGLMTINNTIVEDSLTNIKNVVYKQNSEMHSPRHVWCGICMYIMPSDMSCISLYMYMMHHIHVLLIG